MKTTYGSIVAEKGEGMLRPFRIDGLMGLDVETSDGRLFMSSGAGVRSLPRTVFGGFTESDAHGRNVPIGRLDAVEFDPENNTSTGWGWLLDDDNGRQAALYASTKVLRHNSVHLAEVAAEIQWKSDDPNSPDFMEYTVVFSEWKIASTTMLAIPAFAESTMELTASLEQAIYDSTEVLEIGSHELTSTCDMKLPEPMRELVADGSPKPPRQYFFRPEGQVPEPITLGDMDGNGWIPFWGNLARWGVCHDGFADRCVVAPYSPDEYAGFNASTVLTSAGPVGTGPIFFKGGHPDKPIGNGDPAKAYGGIENAWGDCRVTSGIHGPWICGVVRPGVTDSAVYAARASRISGHWAPDGRLLAIVSVNTPGEEVPRTNQVWTDEEGNVLELVAGFIPDCAPKPEPVNSHVHLIEPHNHSHGFNTNQISVVGETFPMLSDEFLHRIAERMATMKPLDPPRENVDVSDAEAVARHLALLDLEAEEDADAGLV